MCFFDVRRFACGCQWEETLPRPCDAARERGTLCTEFVRVLSAASLTCPIHVSPVITDDEKEDIADDDKKDDNAGDDEKDDNADDDEKDDNADDADKSSDEDKK